MCRGPGGGVVGEGGVRMRRRGDLVCGDEWGGGGVGCCEGTRGVTPGAKGCVPCVRSSVLRPPIGGGPGPQNAIRHRPPVCTPPGPGPRWRGLGSASPASPQDPRPHRQSRGSWGEWGALEELLGRGCIRRAVHRRRRGGNPPPGPPLPPPLLPFQCLRLTAKF